MINWFGLPGLSSSILTYPFGFSVDVQLIILIAPLVQFSPPFGVATIIDGFGIMKLPSLVSLFDALIVLVIFTL